MGKFTMPAINGRLTVIMSTAVTAESVLNRDCVENPLFMMLFIHCYSPAVFKLSHMKQYFKNEKTKKMRFFENGGVTFSVFAVS